MSESAAAIDAMQARWAADRQRDAKWKGYLPTFRENLFREGIHASSEAEFNDGDGAELTDRHGRPAKMRALVSSSALAVNFFDAWRDADKEALSEALALPAPIAELRFEFKADGYPVRPRSPNLDVLLTLANGQLVGVESKFTEPYRSDGGHGVLSARYFPASGPLWSQRGLDGAQAMAERLRPDWMQLDAAQLLKHMLGLAHMATPRKADALLYIWFDTLRPDARAHQNEVERFAAAVAGDASAFRSTTYQTAFARLAEAREPKPGWVTYMKRRYFPGVAAPPATSDREP